MKKITRKQLLQMPRALYANLREEKFRGHNGLFIKYKTYPNANDFVQEEFPITNPEIEGAVDDFTTWEMFNTLGEGVSVPLSDCETIREAMYESENKMYLLYEKEDIQKMIGKLQDVLEGM